MEENLTPITTAKEAAQSVEDYVIATRKALHKMPEVRWEETKTLAFILSEINQLADNRIRVSELKGGLAVNIDFDPSYDRILFRADVDALPIQEATGLDFASEIPGKMHACGHDTHAAMLLGAYKAIMEGKVTPTHNLRLVFQRAEENPLTKSGGATLVEEGVCDGITNAHALHIWVEGKHQNGAFLSRPGCMLANSDRMQVLIEATGGHVALPENGSNAIDIGVRICQDMEGFALRKLGPIEYVSLVPAVFKAGEGSNVMPDTAELWFGVRQFLAPEKREQFAEALKQRIHDIVAMYEGASVEVNYIKGHPMTFNDTRDYELINSLLNNSGETTEELELLLGGEDFGHYLRRVPGSMWCLMATQPGSGATHTPTFNPDESLFWKGVYFWLLLATN